MMNTIEHVIDVLDGFARVYEGPSASVLPEAIYYLKDYQSRINNLIQLRDDLERYKEDYGKATRELTEAREQWIAEKKRMESYELMYIHAMANLEDNPPLSWDDVKRMEGKPLWVEEYYYNGQKKSAGWWLVDTQDDEQIVLRDQAGNPWYAYFISMGTDWKAYRKEIDHE